MGTLQLSNKHLLLGLPFCSRIALKFHFCISELHSLFFFLSVDYIVEYDYDAVHDDELTIQVGEIIRNVKKLEEEGWLEGELNGKRGMFPDNFVKVSFLH